MLENLFLKNVLLKDALPNHLQQSLLPVTELPITERPNIPENQLKLKSAAVLIPLVFNDKVNQWDLILTRRAEHLKQHPGQVSFPGGAFEKTDHDLSYTAIRETQEEIGIQPYQIKLMGKLAQQQTISNYLVTPFVGIIEKNYQLTIDKNEVADVFTVPLEFVVNPINQQRQERFNTQGKNYSFYQIAYKDYNIWGTTANIIANLTERLELNLK